MWSAHFPLKFPKKWAAKLMDLSASCEKNWVHKLFFWLVLPVRGAYQPQEARAWQESGSSINSIARHACISARKQGFLRREEDPHGNEYEGSSEIRQLFQDLKSSAFRA